MQVRDCAALMLSWGLGQQRSYILEINRRELEVKLSVCAVGRNEWGCMSDKHGFRFYQPISPGGTFHHAQTPCLEKPIPHQGLEVIPGIIIMSCTCFKLGFCPSTVQVVASYLISMVFEIRHPKSPGNNMPPERKPCLKHLQQSGAQIGHHQHMF